MITALFIAFITADIAEMFHTRLRGIQFSANRAVLYFFAINLAFICYMAFFRREPFSMAAYYTGPKAVLRYTAYTLGLCAAAPFMVTALTGPKRIWAALKQSVWLPVSLTLILALSAGAYFTYKGTAAVSLTTDYPTYSGPVYPAGR